MQNSNSSSAKEVAGSIDILWEILLWLPLKSLFRLKLVSKRWLTLISNQRFREFHSLHHHPRPTSLILSNGNTYSLLGSPILSFTTTTPTIRVFNLDFLNQSNVIIERSCNGFLLCSSDLTYFICNPITKDFTTLTLRYHPFKNESIDLYLAFDPFISPYYKVFSIARQVEDWAFNEYSFKTHSWISPGVTFPINQFGLEAARANEVYCNRAIHWCMKAEFSVYFDVDTLQLRKWPMPIPDSGWVNQSIMYFGESKGRLYLMVAVFKQDWKYDIFELKEDYSGWSLRHRIDLKPLEQHFTIGFGFTIVCGAKLEDLSMLVLIAGKETLLMYDLVTLRKLCEVEMGMEGDHIRYKLTFGEILHYFENTALVETCTDR